MKNEKRSDKIGAFYIWLDHDNDFFEKNSAFLDSLGIPKRRRIFVSRYTPTVIALLTKEERAGLSTSPYLFERAKNLESEITLINVRADSESGTNSPDYSLFGEGVKVGVISAENRIFDSLAKSLEKKDITVLPSIIPPRIDRHPTAVVSVISGNSAEAEGVEFFGVARESAVYFAPTYSEKNVYEAIERFLDEGVRVINYSAGVLKGDEKENFDRQMDRFIRYGNFLFVVSAGNERFLTSPAKAENALTVGNASTKPGETSAKTPPFEISIGSAYRSAPPHKPEIVAPGEYVGYVDRNNVADYQNFGTSYSAPFVTGVALQLLSIREDISYITLKAILLASASFSKIAGDENPEVAPFMREKSGYGLLDAVRAVEIIRTAEIIEGVYDKSFERDISGNFLFFIYEVTEDEKIPRLFIDGELESLGGERTLFIKREFKKVRVEGDGDGRFTLLIL